MNTMTKLIGGAAGAVVLAFGGVMLSESMSQPLEAAQSLEQAIPVDESVLEASPNEIASGDDATSASQPEMVSNPVVQDVSAASAEKKAAPKKRDDRFVIKRVLPIDGPIKYGEWHWDDKGVPAGPVVVTVDLDARVISVFQNGYEIGAAAVLLGTDDHPTPLGTFPILWKQRHNVSEKYNNAPMPWSLFLTSDGIAIHGGNDVENGYASHGCIGVPNELASRLFAIAKKGDKVIITRGKRIGQGDSII